jgi:hypothetical protein
LSRRNARIYRSFPDGHAVSGMSWAKRRYWLPVRAPCKPGRGS